MSTMIERITTIYTITGSFMSAKMVESSKAVTIYLAISISHLPNSFFMLQSYTIPSYLPNIWGFFSGGGKRTGAEYGGSAPVGLGFPVWGKGLLRSNNNTILSDCYCAFVNTICICIRNSNSCISTCCFFIFCCCKYPIRHCQPSGFCWNCNSIIC